MELLGLWGWKLAFVSVVFGYVFYLNAGFYTEEIPRKRLIERLREDHYSKLYKLILTDFLYKFDRVFSRREIKLPATSPKRAWSRGLIDATLLFAIGFPIGSIMIQWVFTNVGMLGNEVVLPPAEWWIRVVTICGIAATIILLLYGNRSKGLRSLQSIVLAAGLLLGIQFFLSEFALVLAFAVAVVGISIGAGTFAVAFAGAFAFAFAIEFAVVGAFAFPFPGAFAVAFAMAVAFAATFADLKRGERFEHLLALVAFLFVAIVIVVTLVPALPPTPSGNSPEITILFLGIFPMVNAIADFASIGFTRWKLRLGLAGNMPWQAFWDIIVAVAIFVLLGMALILVIHFVRPRDGVPLLDLTAFFSDIKSHPSNYWWLSFTFIWTLAPTLAHFGVAVVSLFTFIPASWRNYVADLAEQSANGDATKGKMAVSFISAGITFALCAPVLILIYAAGWANETRLDLVQFIIAGFESFARLIGAV